MTEFVLSVRVYYEDTDAGGVVYYANYLRYLERARTEWLRSLGVGQADLLENSGLAFVVRGVTVDYLKPARLDDELTVVSRVESHGRAQVVFDQRVLRGEETLTTAQVRVVCVDLRRGRVAAMPEAIYRQFAQLI